MHQYGMRTPPLQLVACQAQAYTPPGAHVQGRAGGRGRGQALGNGPLALTGAPATRRDTARPMMGSSCSRSLGRRGGTVAAAQAGAKTAPTRQATLQRQPAPRRQQGSTPSTPVPPAPLSPQTRRLLLRAGPRTTAGTHRPGTWPPAANGGHDNHYNPWLSLRQDDPWGPEAQTGALARMAQRGTNYVPLRQPARPSCVDGGRPGEQRPRRAPPPPTFYLGGRNPPPPGGPQILHTTIPGQGASQPRPPACLGGSAG